MHDMLLKKRFFLCAVPCFMMAAILFASGCAAGTRIPAHERYGGGILPVVEKRMDGKQISAELDSGTLHLTPDEAVLMALTHNRDLRVIRFEPALRREQELIERSVFDPVALLEASERRARIGPRDPLESMRDEERTALESVISLLHPFGTRWEAGLSADRLSRGDDEESTARLGLSARQPLLRDAGRAVNMARLEQARLDTRLSEYEVRAVAESLVAQVENVYWAYFLALQRIEMVEESLSLAERQLEETRHRIRVGQLPATEEAAAEAEVALRHEARIDAGSRLEILRVRLLRLIAPERLISGDMEVVIDESRKPVENEDDVLETHLANAIRHRPDLNQARLQVERGEIELVRTANGLLPRMDVFARLGKTGYADSFGSAFSDIDGDGYDVMAGVGVEWPIMNREARARHGYAEWRRDQLEESLKNFQDLVYEDVHVAYAEVKRAREQIQAKAATRALQEETVRAETAKFIAGKSTALMVAHAQRGLLAARVAEAEAVVEYRQALTGLYRLDGSLLQRRGIIAPGLEDVPMTDDS